MNQLIKSLKIAEHQLGLKPGVWKLDSAINPGYNWSTLGWTDCFVRKDRKHDYRVRFYKDGDMRIEKIKDTTVSLFGEFMLIKEVKKIYKIITFLEEYTDTALITTEKGGL